MRVLFKKDLLGGGEVRLSRVESQKSICRERVLFVATLEPTLDPRSLFEPPYNFEPQVGVLSPIMTRS